MHTYNFQPHYLGVLVLFWEIWLSTNPVRFSERVFFIIIIFIVVFWLYHISDGKPYLKAHSKHRPHTVAKDTEVASLEMSAENYSVLHRILSWGVISTFNNVSSFQIKPFGNTSVNDLLCPQIFEQHFSWRSLHCSWIKRNMHSPNPLYPCLAGSIRNEEFKKAPYLNNGTDARG